MRKLFQQGANSLRNAIIRIGAFIVVLLICVSSGEAIWGTDESNVLQAPDWYTFFMIFACFATAIYAPKLLDKLSNKANSQKISGNVSELTDNAEGRKLMDSPSVEEIDAVQPIEPPRPTGLDAVDLMDGHQFEYWCAELLRKNGFHDVEVTKASGDQGVDVLASKDGINYAIQCKCYSHDLGNTPVQEVNTGKTFYHRHIGVVMTNRHFTSGAKQAAQATGVLLWDREKLEELLFHASQLT